MAGRTKRADLIVIGTGAAGSAGWLQAVKLGKRVTVFERGVLGGECPTFACVPSKALLYCAEVFATIQGARQFGIEPGSVSVDYRRVKARKDAVVARTGAAQGEKAYRDAGVQLIRQVARFVSPNEVEAAGTRYAADRFLITTGGSTRIPDTPGLAQVGFLTFKEAIDLTRLPKSLLILGGGPVGCEFAQLFSTFGVPVVIADHNEHLLAAEDRELGEEIGRIFGERGVRVLTRTNVISFERAGARKRAIVECDGRRETIEVDEILVATGKHAVTDCGLESAGVDYDPTRGIAVDATLRTSNPAIYAAGDCVGPYRLTHAASYQGKLAVQNAFSNTPQDADYRAIPRCVFTTPEIAAVGLTERQARAKKLTVRIGRASVGALDRASAVEQRAGLVKVLADRRGRLIGASIVAPRAGELIHELGLAIALGATAAQVAGLVHAFPTFSEAIQAACADVKLPTRTRKS
jgi:pyruvate/2-oxoglutarate dehydrogenase complex dihydrolipoamide dehydrogenase (E3) component